MANTYKVNVDSISTYKNLDGLENVVFFVKFHLLGTSEDGIEIKYEDWAHFPEPEGEAFVPFEDITEEIMVSWILDARPDFMSSAKQYVDAEIAIKQQSNVVENARLPWNN